MIIIIASLTHAVFYACYSMRFFPAKRDIIYEPRIWRSKKSEQSILECEKEERYAVRTGHPDHICGFLVRLNTDAAVTVFILARRGHGNYTNALFNFSFFFKFL